jgi:GNAT superfamily N-acetyltransferase
VPLIDLLPATPDIEGYDGLMQESLSEGHEMLRRLEQNWHNGTNTFSRPGELLMGALSGPLLVGICGRNIDPYAHGARTGRVRHLYVRRSHRGQGVGRLLVQAMARDAGEHFDHLNARVPLEAFSFYENLGFARVENDPTVTHRLPIPFTSA